MTSRPTCILCQGESHFGPDITPHDGFLLGVVIGNSPKSRDGTVCQTHRDQLQALAKDLLTSGVR